MKKKNIFILTVLVFLFLTKHLGAVEKRFFQLALLSPVSTDVIGHGPYAHIVSLDLFAGYSEELTGFATGLFNVTGKSTTGMQWGFWNYTGEIMVGFQSGAVNIAMIRLMGVQWGAVNIASGSGGFGWQVGIFNNSGFAFAGYQSGVVNLADNKFRGFQNGLILNCAGEIRGVQMGLVNRAVEMHGLQIGLVNIAYKGNTIPVGVFNFFPAGINRLQISFDTGSFIGIDWHLGWKYIHKVFELSYKMLNVSVPVINTSWGFGVGLGTMIPLNPEWDLRIDAMYRMLFFMDDYPAHINVKVYGAYRWGKGLRLTFGGDLKYFLNDPVGVYRSIVGTPYIGLFAGVELGE